MLASCTQPIRLWKHTLKYTKKKSCGGFYIVVLNSCLHPYRMCGLLAMFAKSNIVVYLVRGFLAIFIKSNSMYPVIRLLAVFVKSNLVSLVLGFLAMGYQIQQYVPCD